MINCELCCFFLQCTVPQSSLCSPSISTTVRQTYQLHGEENNDADLHRPYTSRLVASAWTTVSSGIHLRAAEQPPAGHCSLGRFTQRTVTRPIKRGLFIHYGDLYSAP